MRCLKWVLLVRTPGKRSFTASKSRWKLSGPVSRSVVSVAEADHILGLLPSDNVEQLAAKLERPPTTRKLAR